MVKVIDDVIDTQTSNFILNEVHRLYYSYKLKTTVRKEVDILGNSYTDEHIHDNGQFCSVIMIDGKVNDSNSEFAELLKPIIEAATSHLSEHVKVIGVDRVKVNLILKQPDLPDFHYNVPHKDFPDFPETKHYSMVYYCNDSDGDTFLFEEFHSPLIPDKLNIHKRVTPKQNRAVLFESNRWHCSSNPISSKNRFVINFVFMVDSS
jgi:hypothetical protein